MIGRRQQLFVFCSIFPLGGAGVSVGIVGDIEAGHRGRSWCPALEDTAALGTSGNFRRLGFFIILFLLFSSYLETKMSIYYCYCGTNFVIVIIIIIIIILILIPYT